MKCLKFVVAALCFTSIGALAQDWDGIPIPASAPSGMTWELNPVSDSFNYESNSRALHPEFEKRWNELYINTFSGPSATSYHKDHTWITGGKLNIHAAWDASLPIIYTGCISSKEPLTYPMYMEASVLQAGCMLANNIWMISADETEELDMLESYPNIRENQEYFDKRIHLSHHTFIREPFTDYQPRDEEGVFGTWYMEDGRDSWRGEYFTIGVYWVNPHHAQYYINGKLVRTIKSNEHNFIDPEGNLSEHTTTFDAIDKFGYTGGTGLSKPQHIIINMEQQSWITEMNVFPTPEDLDDANGRNLFMVDWIRVYDAVPTGGKVPVTGIDVVGDRAITIRPGETVDLGFAITPANATKKIVTWEISNKQIAKVNGLGQVTGLSNGTVGATVTTFDGGFSDVVTVTVAGEPIGPIDQTISVDAVSISPSVLTLEAGETSKVTAGIIPFNATVQSVVWSSSNSDVVTISNIGDIIAVAEGTATITATTLDGGKTDSITVTITAGTSTGGGNGGTPTVQVDGGTLTGGPFTFTVGDGVADNVSGVSLSGNVGANSQYVVTDDSGNILGLPPTPEAVNFDDAGEGTCFIYHVSFEGTLNGLSAGENISGFSGDFDLSNRIRVDRNQATAPSGINGGTLSGGPFTFTVGDGIADNVSGVTLTGNTGANSQYVVTDDAGNILGLPPTPEAVNFDEAGAGTCFIYHLSYDGTIGGLAAGSNISGLSGDFDLSNRVRVDRNAVVIPGTPSGDVIIIEAESLTSTDGTYDDASAGGSGQGVNVIAIGVNFVNSGDYADYTINVGTAGDYAIEYLISTPSNDAQIQIAVQGTSETVTDNVPNNGDWEDYTALTSSSVLSLSAGVQTIRISATGTNLWQWNLDKVTLTRQNGGTSTPIVSGGTLSGGPFTFTVDGIADNVSGVTVSENQGANANWVVTDEDLNILGLPPTPQAVNFDEAGVGVCLIWHISYEDGLTGLVAGQNVSGLQGTYELSSNSVRVNRIAAPSGGNATLVIEAEDFDSTDGTIDDAQFGGQGLGVNAEANNINYVNSGDYAEYSIDVAVAGTYNIDYLISSPSNNAQIELEVVGSGASLTTNVPNNGQWDSFEPLSGGTVALTAGTNVIRVTATGSNVWQWNLDKITLSTGTSGAKDLDDVASLELIVYPNPSTDIVFLDGLNSNNSATIHLYDISGAEFKAELNADNSINVESLAQGVYFITVINGVAKQTARFIKH
ncbi:Ig-like domain-containing protein [Aquimarina agarivorans]|uniref:Ig-like domain-containing protein n=1 Tax=Aquimarina agarivorans TaxID=980584 RepID=UPI000248F5D6|nr:Ig-like domain-containing protein [Aquimarina agarivorans]